MIPTPSLVKTSLKPVSLQFINYDHSKKGGMVYCYEAC